LSLCQACGHHEAVYHITVDVSVFGPNSTRAKPVQFILCDSCEVFLQQVLCRDEYLKPRMAARLTQGSAYQSETPKEWRRKPRQLLPIVPT